METELITVWHGGQWRELPKPEPQKPIRNLPTRPTVVQDQLLALLEAQGPLTRRELEAKSGRSFTSVSGTVDRLLGLGLIVESHKVKMEGQNRCWTYKVAP